MADGRSSLVRRASLSLSRALSFGNADTTTTTSSAPRSSSRGSFFQSFSRSGTKEVCGLPDAELHVAAGDVLETLDVVAVRVGEDVESPQLAELSRGVTVMVQFLGNEEGRVKVAAGNSVCGWISTRASAGKNLLAKICIRPSDEFEPGGIHEVKSTGLTMRESEELDSDVLGDMPFGTVVKILEIGTLNRRRAKIQSGDSVGWVSLVSLEGQVLIGKMGQLSSATSDTATMELIEAARQNHLPGVREKLEAGGRKSFIGTSSSTKCDVNASDIRGKTALMHAASAGNINIVNYLLMRSGIEVNRADDSKRTALHHSARPVSQADPSSLAACVQTLYEAKAQLEAVDHLGCTALLLAAQSGIPDVISALLLCKADANRRDTSGQMPAEIARKAGHGDDILALFKQSKTASQNSTGFWPAAVGLDFDMGEETPPEDRPLLTSERSGDESLEATIENPTTGEAAVENASAKKVSKLKRITQSRKSKIGMKLPDAEFLQAGAVTDETLKIDESLLAETTTLETPVTDVMSPGMSLATDTPTPQSPMDDQEGDDTQTSGKKAKPRVLKKKVTKDLKSAKNGESNLESADREEDGVNPKGEDKPEDGGNAKRKSTAKRAASKSLISKTLPQVPAPDFNSLPQMPS